VLIKPIVESKVKKRREQEVMSLSFEGFLNESKERESY